MPLITLDEACKRYPISRKSLFRWAKEGKLTMHKKALDPKTYVEEEEIRRLAEEKRRTILEDPRWGLMLAGR